MFTYLGKELHVLANALFILARYLLVSWLFFLNMSTPLQSVNFIASILVLAEGADQGGVEWIKVWR